MSTILSVVALVLVAALTLAGAARQDLVHIAIADRIATTAVINGNVKVPAIIDTGASDVSIMCDDATRKLDLKLGRAVTVQTANGSKIAHETILKSVAIDAYEDTWRELFDLEARRKDAKPKDRPRLDIKVDDARKRLHALRRSGPAPADAQSTFLSSLTFGSLDPQRVRIALVALFAIMVEMCATLGLFAALSHSRVVAAASPTARVNAQGLGTAGRNKWDA